MSGNQRSSAGRGRPGAGRGNGKPGGQTPGRRRGGKQKPQGTPPKPRVDVHDPEGIRLQKALASAGVGSRRACEELITAGRVMVDGQVITELGVRIDILKQVVMVDGERVQLDTSREYLAFNKPLNVVSTMSDELGRPSVGDYLEMRKDRLFHVGRLDVDTEGLLLLTNDGELANRLQHPSYGVPKTYLALVPGPIPRDLGKQLRAGVELEDGPVKVDSFRLVDSQPGRAMVEVVLHEGRKHVVRRMLEEVGHPVESLVRTDVGPVHLGNLRAGKMRPLTSREISELYRAAGL
ncbi:pseudouridine synthase [Dermacoccaceae bacterium W4C1]